MQGDANVLLEKYADAERAFLEGLSIDPSDEDLQKGLKAVQQHLASSRPGTPTPGSATQPKRYIFGLLCWLLLACVRATIADWPHHSNRAAGACEGIVDEQEHAAGCRAIVSACTVPQKR